MRSVGREPVREVQVRRGGAAGGTTTAALLAGGDEDGIAKRLLRLLPGPFPPAASRAASHSDQGRRRPGLFFADEVEPVPD